MNIRNFIIALLFFCFGFYSVHAQVEIKLNTAKSEFRILEKSPYKLKIKTSVDKIRTMTVSTIEGQFIELGIPGFTRVFDTGRPQLPVITQLIEIPYGSEVQINIISYNEQNIELTSTGIVQKIMPAQPSVSKSADPSQIPFYYDRVLYQTNAFTTGETVKVTTAGIMRGVQVGHLTIAPFRYNPVTNTLKVYNDLVFEIVFKHPDIALTEQMKEKYYSPYFESSLNTMINYQPPAAKDVLTKYPVKYVVISLTSFQSALQPFVYWKRQKGFNVVEKYYTSAPTTSTVKTYLQGLYNAGTPTDPAPTFVLLVGDVAQIPTYSATAFSGYTDLYYFTMDGTSDYIPDMYYGRFSATTTTHVNNQVTKTLQYEKYTMPSASYMDTVVMVAGYDDYGNDATYGNGQINYGTTYYFNASHGIYSHTYLDPNNRESMVGADMRAKLYKGVGFANYTAHCSSSGWAEPSFTTSHVPNMYNANKYGLIIGNCCQSNTFYDTECFGEALLRAYPNKGAVGYIGASYNSLWNEDYYWAVGARSTIQVNPTYDATKLGAYDCVFHDHGEPKTKWFVTNDQMRYAGLLAVEASSSTYKKYYWEEYHLMGDPSVMNYFSVPDPLTVNYTNPQNVGISSLVVNTEEDAYVAISHDGVLYDAELAPVGGTVTLNFNAINQPDTLDVVVTKQNKQPYIGKLYIIAPSIPLDAELVSINNPVNSYNCSGFTISPEVTIRNAGSTTLTSLRITYQVNNGTPQIYNWSGTLPSTQTTNVTLPQITIPEGANNTFTATTSLPNGLADQNTANDSKTKNFSAVTLPVSSDFSADKREFCNAPATVNFTNNSTNATSYTWNFGDGSTSTDANPSHTYTTPGIYTVTLTANAGICGNDIEIKNAYIVVGTSQPIGYDESRCGPGSVTLNASGPGTLNWYDALINGNLLATGTSFTTPILSTTTSYYVESVIDAGVAYTGKPDNSGTGGYFTGTTQHGLIFDTYVPIVLKSVKVYYGGTTAASRTFSLYNSSNTLIESVTRTVPPGESRVTLNLSIPQGTNYKLSGPASPNLYRNGSNTGADLLPITLNNVLSIKQSTATGYELKYYYYFYDWEVELPDCKSARTTVTATILSSPPVAGFNYTQNNQTVNFTNTSTNAESYFWNFGDGNTSTEANPTHSYVNNGIYHVMLVATNSCESDTIWQDVNLLTTSISENSLTNIKIHPNPSKGVFNITSEVFYDKATVCDILNRELIVIESPNQHFNFDLTPYQQGIYLLKLYNKNKVFTFKLNKIQ